MTRYCPSCHAQVADTGGYCLLGHRLPFDLGFEPLDESIQELRAEVDDVLEAARKQIAAVLEAGRSETPVVSQPTPTPAPVAAAPAPPAAAPAPAAQIGEAYQSPPSPPAAEHSPTSLASPREGMWSLLQDATPIKDDPIEAFAPSPRMDWGPDRPSIWRRRSHSRRPSTAAI